MTASTPDDSVRGRPELSVVVPSHDRPLRLRWLLNGLEEQTLARDLWEVIVVHDSSDEETEDLLRDHPLAGAGVLRHRRVPAGSAAAAAKRNLAWRLARAPTVVFTDDDCRPPAGWLESLLAAVRGHRAAVIQGMTLPDPDEGALARAPHATSRRVIPPSPHAETCNIAYPRELLERLAGLDEDLHSGEDTDLMLRARREGVEYLGYRPALTYHAVEATPLVRRVRSLWRWRHIPKLVKRYPEHRDAFPMWMFWRNSHLWLLPAAVGAARSRRDPRYALLALPWVLHAAPTYGGDPRGRIRALSELPGRLAIDVAEVAVLAYGSAKYRTLFL